MQTWPRLFSVLSGCGGGSTAEGGEAQEGEIWEAANSAHKDQRDNLITFVDGNNLQLDGICDTPYLTAGSGFLIRCPFCL